MDTEDRELTVRHLINIMHAIEQENTSLFDEATTCLGFYVESDAYKHILGKLEDLAVAQLTTARET